MANPAQHFDRNTDDFITHEDAAPRSHQSKVVDYYAAATAGYRDWSRNINMHFGYYQWGMNPFDLEGMLENTNRQVYARLQLQGEQNRLLDMGCGVGATARFCAQQPAVERVIGITLAPSQVEEALVLNSPLPAHLQPVFEVADYHHTPYEAQSFDGVYAIESACHSLEKDKRSLLAEAHRLLKPGGRVVICDGFIKGEQALNAFTQHCYDKTCEHWSLGHFPQLEETLSAMEALGFRNIKVDDITLCIFPSASFVPLVALRYLCKLLWTRDKNPQHWHHLLAPVWGFLLGLNLKRFRYCLISGEK